MLNHLQLRAAIACLMLVAGSASAQYKWIDANGRIGYGDQIPSGDIQVLKGPIGFKGPTVAKAAPDGQLGLPIQLRKITRKFPVTLYTTTACAPCVMARQHLKRRGVPYSEKVISTGQDLRVFTERGFGPDTNLPLLVVGSDEQIGYHALRWDGLLTSSGYPKKSRLPRNFDFGQAEALAAAGQLAQPASTQPSDSNGSQRGSVLRQRRTGPSGRPIQPEAPTIRF